MKCKRRLLKIAIDEAHGFIIDVLAPLITFVRWLRRNGRK